MALIFVATRRARALVFLFLALGAGDRRRARLSLAASRGARLYFLEASRSWTLFCVVEICDCSGDGVLVVAKQ